MIKKKSINKKLILFDIDGTLIYHVAKPIDRMGQFEYGLEQTWGIQEKLIFGKRDGWIDIQSAWDIVQKHGITRKQFDASYKTYCLHRFQWLKEKAKLSKLYEPISDARQFVKYLMNIKNIYFGLLTGNTFRIAKWKLEKTGLWSYFSFGLYGDEADNRIELAKLVFTKAYDHFHIRFLPREIFVIGDTVHDVRCGKAIGAVTVAVTTGEHAKREDIRDESPDLLVDTLMDKRVLSLLGLIQEK